MPSWRVHRALALSVSANLPTDVVKGLLEGVVEPDILDDKEVSCKVGRCRIVRMRHHAGVPRGLVEYYYNLACFYRARGDLHAAGVALGRALHYIHDGAVKTAGRAHGEVEKEMDKLVKALPHLCNGVAARRSDKAVEALCYAYLESKRLVEQFMEEPLLPREKASRVLWWGRAKRWGLAAASFALSLAAPLPSFAFLILTLGIFAALMWTPKEYAIAMRSGIICVVPWKYMPAFTC